VKWDAIQTELGRAFRVVSPDPDQFVVGVSVKTKAGDQVQEISLKPTLLDTVPWLAMISPVASNAQLDLAGVMAIQDQILLGGIVARGEVLLLRHGMAMPPLTPEALCWNVAAFGRAALRIRLNAPRPPRSGETAHGHFTEEY
jgi:hypothetical protein